MFSFINFAMDIRIFSCLFVKFVLYTAGFLGEGTLLFLLSPSHFVTAPGGHGRPIALSVFCCAKYPGRSRRLMTPTLRFIG